MRASIYNNILCLTVHVTIVNIVAVKKRNCSQRQILPFLGYL